MGHSGGCSGGGFWCGVLMEASTLVVSLVDLNLVFTKVVLKSQLLL